RAVTSTRQVDGLITVSFIVQETGPSTGVFQLNLNDLRTDLGFNSLNVGDVLVAYYLDPNDEDDFHIATAYIESKDHISITSFTDATRAEKSEYWIGRDPVYVQVIDSNANVDPCCPEQVVVHICDVHEEDDSEWVIADETSSNSPVFFTNAGMQLLPVWDALGIGLANSTGGYQLQLDNWKLEVFNEDSVYARYNDVTYTTDSLTGLGDVNTGTAFPPTIEDTRVANDISFAQMEIADTQVYDGSQANMYFLDRQGNRVSGYVNSDCVFVEVVDPDQDEDQYRRERVDGYWDGGQNAPFGPLPFNEWGCDYARTQTHSVNALLGDTNIFNDEPVDGDSSPKLYVLNPRNGRWAAVDLLETGVATGDFVSVTCIDLTSQYSCVPTLGVKPGDTIVAVYQDPSNHSDSAWITIKVGMGGGGTPPSQASTTMFVDADGNEVTSYTDADSVYVKVIDPSHAGATSLLDAVEINGTTFDLAPLAGASSDTFITDAISLSDIGAAAGDTITATYTDPTDPTDTSSDEITIVASALSVTDFYAAPNPFSDSVSFAYHGTGIATQFSVSVYDLAGHLVWSEELANVTSVEWDGTDSTGAALANGAYIYVVQASDGTNTFSGKGTVFIKR
ncbi:gliding motility-associated C-terminal domain-containing protein, partial [Candidatus Bipolaricaulota bacterium]|nr:gliding motility-associated C-terminal domain-containing protein [Candidatus Bipolaricaulota bacterium]